MKHLIHLMAVIAISFIFATGCKKEMESNSEGALNELQLQNKTITKESIQLSAAQKERLNKLHSSLPDSVKEKLKQTSTLLLNTHPEYQDMVRRALAVEPTPCNSNTALFQWLDQELADWNSEVIKLAFDFIMFDLPTYDALYFENSSDNQYFGVNGEHTQRVTKTFKDLQRFWNIQSNNIVVVAMHGNMLRDREKIIRAYVSLLIPPVLAAGFADMLVELIEVFPQYRDGSHPVFTFNSYAVEGFNFPPYGVIPDKIILGDGILEAYTAIGYNDVAPQALLAHEFGHHIQLQLDLVEDVISPEATRRIEMMADAYSAYYLSHARGASMQWKRVKQFLQVFFNIGDCSFTSEGHHGTPTQRMAAAEWAYNLANNAQKQGHILTSEEFTALFEAQLPELLTH